MKKKILAMLLSALLAANISACNDAPENEIEGTFENIDTTESTFEETDEKTTESETNAETEPTWEGTIACNGVFRNSKVKYAINQDKELILYIEDWDETFVVPNDDMFFVGETLSASSFVVGEDRGALIFGDFSRPPKPIKVIQFTKGNPQVTIENLTYQTNELYSFKYCNFIDEYIGYLFLFSGSDNELSTLLKTTDGGKTWIEQPVETSLSIHRKEDIICAKMLNENVGLIAGFHYSDENFSRRTYITADGGLTWSGVDIQYPQFEPGLGGEEACDILYEDGTYILVCRFRSYTAGTFSSYVWFKYASTDLKTWTLIE